MNAALRPLRADSPRWIRLRSTLGPPPALSWDRAARRGRQYTYPVRAGFRCPACARGRRAAGARPFPVRPWRARRASSAAEATSSIPPGGETGPLARSPSDSKPCRGTGSASRRATGPAGAAFAGLTALARGLGGPGWSAPAWPAQAPPSVVCERQFRLRRCDVPRARGRSPAAGGCEAGWRGRPRPPRGAPPGRCSRLGSLTGSHHCLRACQAAPRGEARVGFPASWCKQIGNRSVICDEALAWEPGEPMGCNVGGAAAVSPNGKRSNQGP